jgi:hypothetical protein
MTNGPIHVLFLMLAVVAGLTADPAAAAVSIADSSAVEDSPAVAHNSREDTFAVAYLVRDGGADFVEIRLFSRNGTPIAGPVRPFSPATVAVGRPDIAYNRDVNEFFVAVAAEGSAQAEILAQRVSADLSSFGSVVPFFGDLTVRRHFVGHGVNSLRVAYNPLLSEYVVTAQIDASPAGSPDPGVWGQILAGDESFQWPSRRLTPSGLAPWSHGVAHAGIGTYPLGGGRYLLAAEGENGGPHLFLFDRDLNTLVSDIPFAWGEPAGDAGFADVAFGQIQGVERFLIVWSDGNNCRPGTDCSSNPALEAIGPWGGFVDPYRTAYPPGQPDNVAFPLGTLARPVHGYAWRTPRAAYNPRPRAFFVAWNEKPANDPANDGDQECTHIRGTWMESLDGTLPGPNLVLSDTTCSCPPVSEGGPPACDSTENPALPAVARLGDSMAVAVWRQNSSVRPGDLDIAGDPYGYAPPVNDAMANASELPGTGGTVDCSLLGATPDGESACGYTSGSPDVWYRYTAPSPGSLRVNTCGTNDLWGLDTGTDTVLSIHGVSGTQLDADACNDDFPFGNDPQACVATDGGLQQSDSAIMRPMTAGATWLIRVTRYIAANGGRCMLSFAFTASASGAGRVPSDEGQPGAPATVDKAPAGQITLAWAPSCLASDTDYAVYEGSLGDFSSHTQRLCSTGGATSATLTPGSGGRYYLIVPSDGGHEGSYGTRTGGLERPAAATACLPQVIAGCR